MNALADRVLRLIPRPQRPTLDDVVVGIRAMVVVAPEEVRVLLHQALCEFEVGEGQYRREFVREALLAQLRPEVVSRIAWYS